MLLRVVECVRSGPSKDLTSTHGLPKRDLEKGWGIITIVETLATLVVPGVILWTRRRGGSIALYPHVELEGAKGTLGAVSPIVLEDVGYIAVKDTTSSKV